MFCIFRYLCVTVYIQLFSFRAASVCLINSVDSVVISAAVGPTGNVTSVDVMWMKQNRKQQSYAAFC